MDIVTKITGGSLSATEFNQIPDEIENAISGTGQVTSATDLFQLAKAIADYSAHGDFYTDSGTATAFVLTKQGSKQAPTVYDDGYRARFFSGSTNSGASTVNISGLGVKNIVDLGGFPLVRGAITSGDIATIVFDNANDEFILITGISGSNKNIIINGAMEIDQRNSAAVPLVANGYSVDRWSFTSTVPAAITNKQQASLSAAQFNTSGFSKALKVDIATGGGVPLATEQVYIEQRIMGLNARHLQFGTANAKSVTVSFWFYSTVAGTYHVGLSNGPAETRSIRTPITVAASTLEYHTVTFAGDTTGTWVVSELEGLRLTIDLGSGSNFEGTVDTWSPDFTPSAAGQADCIDVVATVLLTGVQLEEGSVATPFEHRLYDEEFALCQRYLPAFNSGSINDHIGVVWMYSTTGGEAIFPFVVEPRVAPTGMVSVAGNFSQAFGSGIGDALNTMSLGTQTSKKMARIDITWTNSGAPPSVGGFGIYLANSASAQILFTGVEL